MGIEEQVELTMMSRVDLQMSGVLFLEEQVEGILIIKWRGGM